MVALTSLRRSGIKSCIEDVYGMYPISHGLGGGVALLSGDSTKIFLNKKLHTVTIYSSKSSLSLSEYFNLSWSTSSNSYTLLSSEFRRRAFANYIGNSLIIMCLSIPACSPIA